MTVSRTHLRIAAVGDIHVSKTSQGAFQPVFAQITASADVLRQTPGERRIVGIAGTQRSHRGAPAVCRYASRRLDRDSRRQGAALKLKLPRDPLNRISRARSMLADVFLTGSVWDGATHRQFVRQRHSQVMLT